MALLILSGRCKQVFMDAVRDIATCPGCCLFPILHPESSVKPFRLLCEWDRRREGVIANLAWEG